MPNTPAVDATICPGYFFDAIQGAGRASAALVEPVAIGVQAVFYIRVINIEFVRARNVLCGLPGRDFHFEPATLALVADLYPADRRGVPLGVVSAVQGYSVMVTPLQLARAFCAYANGGRLVEPRVVKGFLDDEGKPNGSLVIVEAEDMAAARALAEGFEEPAAGSVKNYTWSGDASIVSGACLAAIGTPHKSKSISFTTGVISDC